MSQFLDHDKQSLSPLPPSMRDGLIGVSVLAFISFFACISLAILLFCRIVIWKSKGHRRINQVLLLILNLQFANIQQSFAFLLSAHWLRLDGIFVESSYCWTQGWFISSGNLASGFWCLAIAFHSFGSVIFNYEMSMRCFYITILSLWSLIFSLSSIGVVLHPVDIYVRTGLLVSSFPVQPLISDQ